jgi:hypothetical protein
MSETVAPWTIQRITDALGSPAVRQRFLGELNRAQIHEITGIFAKWQGIAEQLLHAVERAHEFRAAELAGEPIPGDWVDMTDQLREWAGQGQARGAA